MSDDDDPIAALARSLGLYDMLHDILRAVQAARETNDPTALPERRKALGELLGEFCQVTGATAELRAEMVEHMLGEPGYEAWAGRTFSELTRSDMARTEGGRTVLRAMAERGVLTLYRLYGAEFARVMVADLRKLPAGREGIFSYIPKPRVARDSGPAHDLQLTTIYRLGYTVGAEAVQLKNALLDRAVAYYNLAGIIHGIAETTRATVRGWTQREHTAHYRKAVQEGAAALAAGTVDHTQILPVL